MRQLLLFSLAATFLILLAGCDERPQELDYRGPFRGKLEAALAISDINTRDTALANLAAEAAAARETEVVTRALAKISDLDTKDKSASTCVDILVQAGESHEATEVAKTIKGTSARDAALKRVAEGNEEGHKGAPKPPRAEAEEK